jgi:hypothetical protein
VREFESKEKDFEGRVRKFEVKQLKVQMEDIKSKENQCDKQVKDIELMENHYEALMKLYEEEIESGKCSSSSSLLRQFHFNFVF